MSLLMPNRREQLVAEEAAKQIEKLGDDVHQAELTVLTADGQEFTVKVPLSALRAVTEVVEHYAKGNAVAISPVHMELTTQEAADMLGVSRPYFVKLLEDGKLPFRKLNSHRRIRLEDVMSYKDRTDILRRQALSELTQLSQELGLYD